MPKPNPTQTLRTLLDRRAAARNREILRLFGPPVDRWTRRLEERILGVIAANRGGNEGVIAAVDRLLVASLPDGALVLEKGLRDLTDWSWESAATAMILSLPAVFWVRRLRPLVPVHTVEGAQDDRDFLGSMSPAGKAIWLEAEHRADGSFDHEWYLERAATIDAEIEIERILDGKADRAEAMAIIRSIEFPPPTAAQVDGIISATTGPDGLSAMERIRTVGTSDIGKVHDLVVRTLSGGLEGADAVASLSKPLRALVGNTPGQTTGMNYRAKRIGRTEGSRIAEAGLRAQWDQVGDLMAGVQWFSALLVQTAPRDASLHLKKYFRTSSGAFIARDGETLPNIPLHPNGVCWTSPFLRPDLLEGLPEENLGSWHNKSMMRAERDRLTAAELSGKGLTAAEVEKELAARKRGERADAAAIRDRRKKRAAPKPEAARRPVKKAPKETGPEVAKKQLAAEPRMTRRGKLKPDGEFIANKIKKSEVEPEMELALQRDAEKAGLKTQELIDAKATEKTVKLDKLESGQSIVEVDGVRHFIDNPDSEPKLPLVIQFGDRQLVRDGNTRLSAKVLAGEGTAKVRVLRVSPTPPKPTPAKPKPKPPEPKPTKADELRAELARLKARREKAEADLARRKAKKPRPQLRLKAVESDIAGGRKETAVIFDSDGNELFRKTGTSDAVAFSSSEARRMKGATITHNHPAVGSTKGGGRIKNLPLSGADGFMLVDNDIAEIRAVTEDFTFSLRPKPGASPDARKIRTAWGRREKVHYRKETARLGQLVADGELSLKEAGRLGYEYQEKSQHLAWLDIADKNGLEYKREKRNG